MRTYLLSGQAAEHELVCTSVFFGVSHKKRIRQRIVGCAGRSSQMGERVGNISYDMLLRVRRSKGLLKVLSKFINSFRMIDGLNIISIVQILVPEDQVRTFIRVSIHMLDLINYPSDILT